MKQKIRKPAEMLISVHSLGTSAQDHSLLLWAYEHRTSWDSACLVEQQITSGLGGKNEKEEIESKYPPLEGSLQKVPVEDDPQNPTLSSSFRRTDRNPKCGP